MKTLQFAGFGMLAVLLTAPAFAAGLGSQSLSVNTMGSAGASYENSPAFQAGPAGGSPSNTEVNIDDEGNVTTQLNDSMPRREQLRERRVRAQYDAQGNLINRDGYYQNRSSTRMGGSQQGR